MIKIAVDRKDLSALVSHTAAKAGVDKGEELGIAVAVAVVDGASRLMAFLRAPDAYTPSTRIAINKASTAAGFRMESGALYEMVKESDAVLEGLRTQKDVALFGGGIPVFFDGAVIGAIGVSGGSEEQDIECAEAGLAAIEKLVAAAS